MTSETLIINSPNIETIQLQFNSLDKNSLTGLSILIQDIYSPHTPVGMSKKIMPNILNLLDNNLALLELDLSRICLSESNIKDLSDRLKDNKTIKILNLSCTATGPQGIEHLAETLEMNQSLESLILDDNKIDTQGAQHLAKALEINSSLKILSLNRNDIHSHGTQSLAGALKINSSLEYLNLNSNRIGPEGAKAIGEALRSNQSLKHLDLACNTIGIKGTEYLAEGLEDNVILQSLKLSHNEMTNTIQNLLQRNHALLTEQRFKKTKPVVENEHSFFQRQIQPAIPVEHDNNLLNNKDNQEKSFRESNSKIIDLSEQNLQAGMPEQSIIPKAQSTLTL